MSVHVKQPQVVEISVAPPHYGASRNHVVVLGRKTVVIDESIAVLYIREMTQILFG